ncbi:MAG: hypothetical protein A2541_01370 [Candidatus Taylorbacteria bacterium RIFOXYD2_FULL_36_9]|uniref:Carboxypeptidase regulatory-like domain-containing protein n=1 Tax=Candidatus Taylorbacteria bacterium RIFOXYD2_FULL_36_9 TaxID=1802338 RepID=A0A1G2PGV2_9BACT|nr:MAG: hypothetical protein A2541_01370 [Candidatus Taylorbacteria bacterium RIFOXYD2_FULL_36_9]
MKKYFITIIILAFITSLSSFGLGDAFGYGGRHRPPTDPGIIVPPLAEPENPPTDPEIIILPPVEPENPTTEPSIIPISLDEETDITIPNIKEIDFKPIEKKVSSPVSFSSILKNITPDEVVSEARKIVDSPVGSAVTKTVTTAGVVGGGVAVSTMAFNGVAVADFASLPFKLWGLLLSALGLKKRNRPWGTVYDSITKQPIDPAYVMLKKVGSKEENMSITDLDGRYGFFVTPGKYILSANKTNYTFPSKRLVGKTADALYGNLYFGEELDIQTVGALISKNIPLDPDKFDWNEFTKGKKKLMRFYSKREKFIRILTDWIFRLGLVVSVVSLFLVPAPYNLIIFGLYVLLTILRKFGLKQKALGSLTEKDGSPLSFAIVRVLDAELNTEIVNKVADKIGRYYCLVPKGKYYVKVEKKNDDESYSTIYTSSIFDAENGMVNKNFVV